MSLSIYSAGSGDHDKIASDAICSISFNEGSECFCTATNDGFCTYDTDKCSKRFKRDGLGPIKLAKMIGKANILILVGSDNNPTFSSRSASLFDDKEQKKIATLDFSEDIQDVLVFNIYRMVVVLESSIFVYNLTTLKLIKKIDTFFNPKGLCAIFGKVVKSEDSQNDDIIFVVACPSVDGKGKVHIEKFDNSTISDNTSNVFTIEAHTADLQTISINTHGSLLATTSDSGTHIRVFDITDISKAYFCWDFLRGSDTAKIYSIAMTNSFLMATSSKPTVHLFHLDRNVAFPPGTQTGVTQDNSYLTWVTRTAAQAYNRSVGNVIRAFSSFSPLSPSTLNTTDSPLQQAPPSICCFSSETEVIIIYTTGAYFKYQFNNNAADPNPQMVTYLKDIFDN